MTLTLFSRSLHYKDSKSKPCVHSIPWINRWNLIKLAQIHHWDWGKKWLDFGDLYLVFNVTPALLNSNFDRKKRLVCTLYLEPMAGIYTKNQQNGMCVQRRLRYPTKWWASAQSDRVFTVRMKKACVLSCPLNAQRRFWSDWADAQGDLSLHWAHIHFVGFVMSWLKCHGEEISSDFHTSS